MWAVAEIGWTAAIIALLWLMVRAIDRLDRRYSRKYGLVIVVPESADADVINLDSRRAS